MIPIVELAYSTVASASGLRNGGATIRKKMKIATAPIDRTHLGTNQQALHTIAFLDPFVADDLVTGNVQISLV